MRALKRGIAFDSLGISGIRKHHVQRHIVGREPFPVERHHLGGRRQQAHPPVAFRGPQLEEAGVDESRDKVFVKPMSPHLLVE